MLEILIIVWFVSGIVGVYLLIKIGAHHDKSFKQPSVILLAVVGPTILASAFIVAMMLCIEDAKNNK